ncbi:MAG: PAS domain-containing protein [Candidatus Omnitrophota bacterium]
MHKILREQLEKHFKGAIPQDAGFREFIGAVNDTYVSFGEGKGIEEELWESRERYRALTENNLFGIAVLDTNYRIIMVNAAFARLFKKPAAEFVGKFCFNEFEKRDAVCLHCPGKRAMVSGKMEEVETQGVRDDGTRFHVRNRAIPFFGPDGKLRGFIEMVEDIDERKKAQERQKRLLEDLEEMNRIMVGRELKMLELKKEVNRLSGELGRPAPYGEV